MTHLTDSIDKKSAVALFALFLAFRFLLMYVYNSLTGGQELASDVDFHDMIISDPLAILRGEATEIASYPPFQWAIEWPIYTFFANYFSQMISYRMLMVTIEAMSFATLAVVLNRSKLNRKASYFILLLFIFSPHQYFASIFFVQEDVIAQLFLLIAILFLLEKKNYFAIATLSVGVLVAKLFLVIPLFYVVMFDRKNRFSKRIFVGLLSILPIAVVYYFTVSNALLNGGNVPIRDFTPDAAYAANYWVLLLNQYPDKLMLVKNVSLIVTLLTQCALLFVAAIYFRKSTREINPAILLTLPLAVFFATFYQHMPEYLLLLWPAAILLYRNTLAQLAITAAMTLAWLPRVLHGWKNIGIHNGTAAEARINVLGSWSQSINMNGESLHQYSLVMQTIFYTLLLTSLIIKSRSEINHT